MYGVSWKSRLILNGWGRGESVLVGWNDEVIAGCCGTTYSCASDGANTLRGPAFSCCAAKAGTRYQFVSPWLNRDVKLRSKDDSDTLSFLNPVSERC